MNISKHFTDPPTSPTLYILGLDCLKRTSFKSTTRGSHNKTDCKLHPLVLLGSVDWHTGAYEQRCNSSANCLYINRLYLATRSYLFNAKHNDMQKHSVWTGSVTRGSHTKTDCLHPLVLLGSKLYRNPWTGETLLSILWSYASYFAPS